MTCLCYCATNYSTLPTISTDQGNRAYTAVWQIRLSTSNKDTLPAIEFPLLEMSFECVLNSDGLSFIGSTGSEYTNNLYCFGMIHSRNTANGLRVSSSTMVAPQSSDLLSVVSLPSGSYYNAVIADWQATDEAVLQGGLSAASTYSAPVLLGLYNSSYEVNALPYEETVTTALQGSFIRLKVANGKNLTANMFTLEGALHILPGTITVSKLSSPNAPDDAYSLNVVLKSTMQVDDSFTISFGGSVIWSCTRTS